MHQLYLFVCQENIKWTKDPKPMETSPNPRYQAERRSRYKYLRSVMQKSAFI